MSLLRSSAFLLLGLSLPACASAPTASVVPAPRVAASASPAATTPEPTVSPPPPAPPRSALPQLAECDRDAASIDEPCPQDILVSSAMSHLGKTAAEFDGVTMVLVEYDPDELLEEAFSNPEFRRWVANADTDPRDGQLSSAEARAVEEAVLAKL